ncbi:MAG: transcriptional regulator [Terriglobus roseus]|nr:transcriptional regulator [Terriglobus roseus]
MTTSEELLQRELWSSWAGVLRSYAAVHSLGREQHAVVEVSENDILLRYGTRWLHFQPGTMQSSENGPKRFALTVNGMANIDGTEDEMDLTAERLTREIITV